MSKRNTAVLFVCFLWKTNQNATQQSLNRNTWIKKHVLRQIDAQINQINKNLFSVDKIYFVWFVSICFESICVFFTHPCMWRCDLAWALQTFARQAATPSELFATGPSHNCGWDRSHSEIPARTSTNQHEPARTSTNPHEWPSNKHMSLGLLNAKKKSICTCVSHKTNY